MNTEKFGKVWELLRSGEIKKVFLEIRHLELSIELNSKLTLLEGRYSQINKESLLGIISGTDYNVELNKIRYDLTEFLKELEGGNLASETILKNKSSKVSQVLSGINAPIIIILLIVVFLLTRWSISSKSNSIFDKLDKESFNVLIIRFEDYANNGDTYCIGRAIQEHLNILKSNDNLPLNLNVVYADSISPPPDLIEARKTQKRHNADLIIYGLAAKIEDNCGGADICFRYNINPVVTSDFSDIIEVNLNKHDAKYTFTSPLEIEKGELEINSQTLKDWITLLVNMKGRVADKAFLELDKESMGNMISKNERIKRYFEIGQIYIEKREFSRAKEVFDRLVELSPTISSVYFNRALVYYYLKNYQEAIADCSRAINLKEKYDYFKFRGLIFKEIREYRKSIADFNKVLSITESDWYYLHQRGLSYFELKDYESAICDFEIAMERNSQNHRIYHDLGTAYCLANDYDTGIPLLTTAIEMDSSHMRSFVARGRALCICNRELEGIEDLSHAISFNLPNDTTRFIRGECYLAISEFQAAIRDYNYLLHKNLHSKRGELFHNKGVAFEKLFQRDSALVSYNKALEFHDPLEAEKTYNNLAYLYYEMKNLELSELYLDSLLMTDSIDKVAYIYKGNINLYQREYKRAIEAFKNALNIDPTYHYAYAGLGRINRLQKNYDEAIKNFSNALKFDSEGKDTSIIQMQLYTYPQFSNQRLS